MSAPAEQDDVGRTLGLADSSHRSRRIRLWAAVGLLVVAAGTAGVWLVLGRGTDGAATFITAPVERGGLVVTVTATGTLEPTTEVEVSSELSGMIRKVLVDNNDTVSAGQVLAELDTDKLEAQVTRARATLAAAAARVKEAEAALNEARRSFERNAELARKRVVSEHELDVARAAFERAEAALDSARADVEVARADLQLRETDLEKACICSPIDGVVLRRAVDPGQTVAATLQAPTLFTLAGDLAAMELRVDVDEADISLVAAGQDANFTVDAYPDRAFPARVTKVRFAPETTEGVVTYETSLAVDNAALLLRPGMTATAQITVKTVTDALLVPNEALRFSPPATEAEDSGGLLRRLLPRPPRRRPSANEAEGRSRRVWVVEAGALRAIPVETGLSDGRMTEIRGGGVAAGMAVVTDLRAAAR
ncbi:MAG: efflux RND transporter periplasmic adaptor subunit [Rhodospirillales bacterium]|nr:MAG: efflux RND transporter periplasmic adaptor subunit [Rhodospirillales bacterium]